ncbi:MAG TPA: hypothetical protein VKU80_16220 [Planctomycetota bacterium]|nr:hypothetical protein [Planctomycetota bacterium]
MSEPRTHRKTGEKSLQDHDARDPKGPAEEQFRISCKGRGVGEVLDDLVRALANAESRNVDPLIVMEDLGLLTGSLTTLIKGLCRLLVGFPRTVTFWESSGFTEAFLSAMEPGSIRARPEAPGRTAAKSKRIE